jgi:hypothetical protein
MRFLADENCDFAVVRALRAEGHAVKKDFGQLVFAERRATGGVSGGASAGRLPPGGAARGEAGRQLRRHSAGPDPGRPQAPRGSVSDSPSKGRYAEGPLSIRQGASRLPLGSSLSAFAPDTMFAHHCLAIAKQTPCI